MALSITSTLLANSPLSNKSLILLAKSFQETICPSLYLASSPSLKIAPSFPNHADIFLPSISKPLAPLYISFKKFACSSKDLPLENSAITSNLPSS